MAEQIKVKTIYFFFIITFVALTGCSSGQKSVVSPTIGDQVNEQIPTIVKPKVKVLDKYNVQIIERTPNSLTLSGEVPSLERDDVLVSGQGEGLLRKVVSVHRNRNGITIQTVPASLEDVFEQAHIHISKVLTPDDIILIEPLPEGVTLATPVRKEKGKLLEITPISLTFIDKIIFGNEKNNIKFTGKASVKLIWDIMIKIVDGKLAYFLAYIELKFNLSFITKCSISLIQKEFKTLIAIIRGKRITVYVAAPGIPHPIPLVFTPEIWLYKGFKGTLVAGLELGIIMETGGKIGVEFVDGFWHPIAEVNRNMKLPQNLEIKPFGNLSAQVFWLYEFKIKLYEALGSSMRVKKFIEGSYTFRPNPAPTHTIDLLGGSSISVGAALETPLLGYKIASYESKELESKVHLPPFPITLSGSAEVPVSIQ